MTVLPVRVLPTDATVLRRKANKINRIDASIQTLIDDMIESMYAAEGVGIAAPQVGVSLRVVVIGLPDEEPFALINPEIVKRSGVRRIFEGCLSVPGYRGEIQRSVKVLVKGFNREGKEIRVKAEDNLLAQALEHEIDHINGTIYIDHLETMDDLYTLEELARVDADGEQDAHRAGAAPPRAGSSD